MATWQVHQDRLLNNILLVQSQQLRLVEVNHQSGNKRMNVVYQVEAESAKTLVVDLETSGSVTVEARRVWVKADEPSSGTYTVC